MSKKILIIRFSSIGDIVLTTPVVRCIATQTDYQVHYCTKASYAKWLSSSPYIDKIHVLDGSLWSLLKELREHKFDYIIDLHGNLRTSIIKSAKLFTKSYSFNKLNLEKWLYTNFKIDTLPNKHIVERYLATAKALGVKDDGEGLDYFIPQETSIPTELPKKYVVFAIGGQHNTKKLPLNKLILFCDKINTDIVLLGGSEDVATANKIEDFFDYDEAKREMLHRLNKKTQIWNVCGKTDIHQSALIIQKASHVFSHDTGMMHIAAALNKHIYSIWGSTAPKFGMYPYRTPFSVLENNNLSCRPCSKIGHKKCPSKHFKCMNELEMDFFLEK